MPWPGTRSPRPRRPIVLVPRRPGTAVADAVAPGLPELGLLLPYSPLHHLLVTGVGRPLVMTSGNLSDEPIAHDDDDAVARLGPLVDGLLTHDRPIHIRCDDSVARAAPGRLAAAAPVAGLRARTAPAARSRAGARSSRVGAELKSTVSVAKGATVVPSHHIGDLEHLATYRSFLQAVDHLCHLYGVHPEVVAHDLHPEYLSTKLAARARPAHGRRPAPPRPRRGVHGRARSDGAGAGLAFDGLGYGPDGTLWGGEVLVADLRGYERVAHLAAGADAGWRGRHPRAVADGRGVGGAGRRAQRRAGRAPGLEDGDAGGGARPVRARPQPSHDQHGPAVRRRRRAARAAAGGVSYEAQAAIELEALARTVPPGDAPTYDGTVTSADVDATAAPLVLDPRRSWPVWSSERDRGGLRP